METLWENPPEALRLDTDTPHVWRVMLEDWRDSATRLREVLSGDELTRADRFRFEADRMRYVTARALLRHLLARYLRTEPDQIAFRYTAYGKPELAMETVALPLFNVSHADGIILIAFSGKTRIGVDVEALRPLPDRDALAKRFFAPAETAVLLSLPLEERHAAFFRIWTRKEAYIKARGEGLSIPLDGFEVTAIPDKPPLIERVTVDGDDAARWTLIDLPPGPGYMGALAVEQVAARVGAFSCIRGYWGNGL